MKFPKKMNELSKHHFSYFWPHKPIGKGWNRINFTGGGGGGGGGGREHSIKCNSSFFIQKIILKIYDPIPLFPNYFITKSLLFITTCFQQ